MHTASANKQPIHAMWIFKAKLGPQGNLEKLKARAVANGNEQTPRIDFLETFALVVCSTTICTILALAARKH